MDGESFEPFLSPEFKALPERKKFRSINEFLLQHIKRSPAPAFLLPWLVNTLTAINDLKVLAERLHLNDFEFWLIHYSGLEFDEIRKIRGKITGKYLPRDVYQNLFPIGSGKVFEGSHIVCSHLSPDVDTTVASYLVWMEAFSAPVSNRLQVWNVPNGAPSSPVMNVMKENLGEEVFDIAMQKKTILSLTAEDLLTTQGFIKSVGDVSISSLDHGLADRAIVLVDKEGKYIGDWRSSDVEGVRQIIVLFKAALKNFENSFLMGLTRLLANPKFGKKEVEAYLAATFDRTVKAEDLTEKEEAWLDATLKKVARSEKGIQTSFQELFENVDDLSLKSLKKATSATLQEFLSHLESLDRPELFKGIEKLISILNKGMFEAREWIEKLSVAIEIKQKVLGASPHTLSLDSDVDEIRLKMKHYDYLTVTVKGNQGYFPVGIVLAQDLHKAILGTVTFCDFSNFEEVNLPAYLSVISIIDHHKSDFKTYQPSLALIADTQSCNILVAETQFGINDAYTHYGLAENQIESQLSRLKPNDNVSYYQIDKLLRAKKALSRAGEYFIHPDREKLDYLLALYAILDDTDLLTKVTPRDIAVVKELMNRLAIFEKGEVADLISFEEIPQDADFPLHAAALLLQLPDMYKIYQRTLSLMELEVENELTRMEQGTDNSLFSDTKDQNGIASITQIKLFSENFNHFDRAETKLREKWVEKCVKKHSENTQIDLFILMVSTIPSAEELGGCLIERVHRDAIWFWVPEKGEAHLSSFLTGFQSTVKPVDFELIFINDEGELATLFHQNFKPVGKIQNRKENIPGRLALLQFKPGLINSRKAMISPHLPRITR